MSNFWLGLAAIFIFQSYAAWRRLLAYMRYVQQEGYDPLRFLRWVKVRPLADPLVWLSAACALLFSVQPALSVLVFLLATAVLAYAQPDPRDSGKIPLRMTWRAKRIIWVSLLLEFALWCCLIAIWSDSGLRAALLIAGLLFLFSPLFPVAANELLRPYEKHVQGVYEGEARARVRDIRPRIIGITGSYGKSSSKAVLAHILGFHKPTLSATGSVNTLMGLTGHIRANLKYGFRFMVVEMGAYKIGSIARVCQLAPPAAGWITAVGDVHLERFGSTEAIVRAKGELARAVPDGGVLVVNADSPGALRIAKTTPNRRTLLYGETSTEDLETRLESLQFSEKGTRFTLRTRGNGIHHCFTPLLGRPIIQNLAGAFTIAAAMGVEPELIVAAFRTLRPVDNRLEVVEEQGIFWVRDAYNSNQIGFRAALEVAVALPVSRRFLVTPGVIELGPEQFRVNQTLAGEAAAVCDKTLIVSGTNREAFVAGHRDAGEPGKLVLVENRNEAFRWIRENVRIGDAVILENDLPDLYESPEGLFFRSKRPVGAGARA